jgi:hypothetical protein
MSDKRKGILIDAICGYLRDQIAIGNKRLTKHNLWDQQKPFDYADMWFRLAFMSDDAINEIAGKILG